MKYRLIALTVAAGAALAVGVAPASAAPRTTYGASTPAASLGALPIQRVFYDSLPADPPNRRVVASFTRWDPAAAARFIHRANAGSVIVYNHEPEPEVLYDGLSPDTFAARTIALATMTRGSGVTPAVIVMGYILDPRAASHYLIPTLLRPSVLSALRSAGGFLGWDIYAGALAERTPEDMYGPLASWSRAHRIPWAVTETGSVVPQPARWTDTFTYLSHMPVPPRYFLAWNPENRNDGVYAIQNQPAVAAVWRSAFRR